jgi:hypothetical protein
MPRSHPTTKLRCPFPGWNEKGRRAKSQLIDIDTRLAPLMEAVWANGIETTQCCQEVFAGLAQIEFEDVYAVGDWLFIAQREYKVDAHTWDEGNSNGKGHTYGVALVVQFPTSDIPTLVEKFRAAARPKKIRAEDVKLSKVENVRRR